MRYFLGTLIPIAMDPIVLLLTSSIIGITLWCLRRYMRGSSCLSFSLVTGKTIIITGGNRGIGKETAMELAQRGAHIIIACRDVHKGRVTRDEIIYKTQNEKVDVMKLDLASLDSIQVFAEEFLKKQDKLHILINNAGVMMIPFSKTQEGFEMQFGVNYLGHFLLTNLLLEKLIQSQPSRIINVSSMLHNLGSSNFNEVVTERNYSRLGAYCKSKLANVMFTRSLATKLQDTNVTVYALHPGIVDTDLILGHLFLMDTFIIRKILSPLRKIFLKSAGEGAQTSIYCAISEELADQSGLYYSDCSIKKPNAKALDEDLCEQLWDLSEKYVKSYYTAFPLKKRL